MRLPVASQAINLAITSPKRILRSRKDWAGFFPYYAGYSEEFAKTILRTSNLEPGSIVLDPWNGSGTTTYAASKLGFTALGLDINPVMVIVAQARLLAPNEADALRPLAAAIINHLRFKRDLLSDGDPLNLWFKPETAEIIRAIEKELRVTLVGNQTLTSDGVKLKHLSGIAATLYVALFNTCRNLAYSFQSTNPTWMRQPGTGEKVHVTRTQILRSFTENVRQMASSLHASADDMKTQQQQNWMIDIADTTNIELENGSVDFVLTSPPYCTRIDYAAATRIELAVIDALLQVPERELARRMIGSTRVPTHKIEAQSTWGPLCNEFLEKVRSHSSKASSLA